MFKFIISIFLLFSCSNTFGQNELSDLDSTQINVRICREDLIIIYLDGVKIVQKPEKINHIENFRASSYLGIPANFENHQSTKNRENNKTYFDYYKIFKANREDNFSPCYGISIPKTSQ